MSKGCEAYKTGNWCGSRSWKVHVSIVKEGGRGQDDKGVREEKRRRPGGCRIPRFAVVFICAGLFMKSGLPW